MLEIKNGNVIDPVSGTIELLDIFIQNGCIVSMTGSRPEKTIDASGFYVAPGLVDIHVHFRDPGMSIRKTFIREPWLRQPVGLRLLPVWQIQIPFWTVPS